MSITAIKQAVEALTDSVDLVRNEYQYAVDLYGCYPTRAARINGLLSGLKAHEDAITALRTAIQEAEACEPVAYQEFTETGEWFLSYGKHPTAKQNPLFLAAGAQPAPKQEPEDKCWCDATGIGEPGVSCGDCPTRDYAAPAQAQHYSGSSTAHVDPFMQAQERKPLTDEQITEVWRELRAQKEDWSDLDFARAIEAYIKEQP